MPPAPQAPPQPLTGIARDEAFPYIAPFAVYIGFMILQRSFPGATGALLTARFAAVALTIAVISRKVVSWSLARPVSSLALGVVVFLVWIGPDVLWRAYRGHWLFQNPLTGGAGTTLPADLLRHAWFLGMRTVSSFLLVPILEELFWRGWLMRWVIRKDFLSLPLGSYTALSFWSVALLFAAEHGPYWEVGLAAGIAYNWWLVRTRSLGDCILAHAVTNACLAAYVLLTHSFQYWL